jgi:hypothetical protein
MAMEPRSNIVTQSVSEFFGNYRLRPAACRRDTSRVRMHRRSPCSPPYLRLGLAKHGEKVYIYIKLNAEYCRIPPLTREPRESVVYWYSI